MGFVENYSGIHSIDFIQNGSRLNTWRDFHLIPTKRPELVEPVPNSQSVMIPGTDKRIDIVSSLPEGITYDIRQGSWEFVIDHDQWSSWDEAYRELAKAINGNAMTIMLDDGSVYGYSGRLRVSGYNPGANWSTITIMYILDGRRYVVGRLIHKDITQNGNYNAMDDGAEGYSDVTVTVPTIDARIGTKSVTSNGSYYARHDNYDGYSRVDVNVPATVPRLQEKTTTVNGDVTADSGYDGLSLVSVNVDTSVSPGDHQEYTPPSSGSGTEKTENASIYMITIVSGDDFNLTPVITIGNTTETEVVSMVDFSNAVVECMNIDRVVAYPHLAFNNQVLVNSEASPLVSNSSLVHWTNQSDGMEHNVFTGRFTTSGSEIYILASSSQTTSYIAWKISNISFNANDTYAFEIKVYLPIPSQSSSNSSTPTEGE